MIRAWSVAAVRKMEGERERFAHVAKHLYRARERWEQVSADLGDAGSEALRFGCTRPMLAGERPDYEGAGLRCRAHVLRDHDQRYAPAYMAELEAAATAGRFGALKEGPRGWAFVGDRGVYVVVREVGPSRTPQVKTAYRHIPRHPKDPGPEDFFKQAVRKLSDKTSWTEGGE